MDMTVLFNVAVSLLGRRELRRVLMPSLPDLGDEITLDGKTYIVTKRIYDLSDRQGDRGSAIPAKTIVRPKTDNDY